MRGLVELAAGIFRFEVAGVIDVNCGIVVGDDGVCVIDSGTVEADARAILAAVRSVSDRPVRYAINTHHHGDHSLGNWWMRPAIVVGHDRCRLRLLGEEGEAHKDLMARLVPMAAEQIRTVPLDPPSLTFASMLSLHVGRTALRLRHCGRGHTDNDIVVCCEEAGIAFAGDLIEEGGPPWTGDSFPAEWGATLRGVQPLAQLFVPGHGRSMEAASVAGQAAGFEQFAAACAESRARGGGPAEAPASLPGAVRAFLGHQLLPAVERYFATVEAL